MMETKKNRVYFKALQYVFYFLFIIVTFELLFMFFKTFNFFITPAEKFAFLPWDIDNVNITLSRVLGLGGFLNSKDAFLLDCAIDIINTLVYLFVIYNILVLLKSKEKFSTIFFEKNISILKRCILIFCIYTLSITILEIYFLLIIYPPINWNVVTLSIIKKLFKGLALIVLLHYLLALWNSGISLQNENDEIL